MSRALIVQRSGPAVTVQDLGRPGYLAYGLSCGGAADRLAIAEGATLLGQDENLAALEMAGMGGEFEATEDLRIALTGAPMPASVDGARVAWNASHLVPKGARLKVGAAETGTYGYLHIGGGVDAPLVLGGRGAHLASGIGAPLKMGDRLSVGPDWKDQIGMKISAEDRYGGGTVRIVPSLQTDLFSNDERARFEMIAFQRDARGNRMGVRLEPDGEEFVSVTGLSVLSEVIVPGDIQITGDGTPFVLLGECQTTGGYPRIASVVPADLPKVVQARPGEVIRFTFISLDEAVAIQQRSADLRSSLSNSLLPLIRDPSSISDLLSYQLISGVTAGDDL